MNPPADETGLSTALMRIAAEAELVRHPVAQAPAPATEVLLHELQIYQIELEMQNEALRQAQSALEESRDRYVDLYEFAPVGYLCLSVDGLIEQVNLTCTKLLRRERNKVLQMRFPAWVIPEDRDRWHHLFLNVKRSDGAASADLTLQRGDGTLFVVQLGCERRQDSAGDTVVRVSLTDITELKKVENRLKQRELELSAIIETEPECVKQLDKDGCLLQMNQAGLNMIEADALDQVVGQPFLGLVAPQHRDALNALTEEVFRGKHGVLAFEITGRKGTHRWLESHAVPLRDSEGNIISLLSVTRDITERKQLEDQMRQLAFHDTLTQLPNRRLLVDRLSQAMSASKRSGNYGALMMLDMDNFKPFNDALGHQAGDLLLVEVARRLIECVRETDTVARVGGDEFVVILGELSANQTDSERQAAEVAEKVRVSLAAPYQLILNEGGQADMTVEHRCSASIGVALFLNHEASQSDVLKWADSAMYCAKDAGRNAISFFSLQNHDQGHRRKETASGVDTG